MKINWFGVFYNSIKGGWVDSWWGCKARWFWHFERFIPYPFSRVFGRQSPANRKMMYALLDSYYTPKRWHFVMGSSSNNWCQLCGKRGFDIKDYEKWDSLFGHDGRWFFYSFDE